MCICFHIASKWSSSPECGECGYIICMSHGHCCEHVKHGVWLLIMHSITWMHKPMCTVRDTTVSCTYMQPLTIAYDKPNGG